MIKNFDNKVVLTSQYPEAFLTFSYNNNLRYIKPVIDSSARGVYINGWLPTALNNIDGSAALILDVNKEIAPFHIYTTSVEDFEYNVTFNLYSDPSCTILEESTDVSILNRPFILDAGEFNSYNTYEPLVDNETSYLLLKTNPKYSGNIKLVADTSNNLFLDTFKVSDLLSNKKYRKQKVSGNSFLSGDIRTVFSSLPRGEIYKTSSEDLLNLQNPRTSYSDQYITTYDYGAKILTDDLYDQEYSILAPLWINSKLPDYFAVFRLGGTFNMSSYDNNPDLSDLALTYISDSSLIESWNLKENKPIGKYLNNHLSELLKIESPVNLSLNEYDPNTWSGIAIDKGIITGRSEVPYFFEQSTDNFTDLNAFVSKGFERQNLLCPNLLNMEYIFNDKAVEKYSMNRYFGLYLTENELYNFSYYSDSPTSDVRIISLDGRDVSIFINSNLFDASGYITQDYKNRIFVLNDQTDLKRIRNINQFDGNSRNNINDYINKAGLNILSTKVKNKNFNKFITLKINNRLYQGEHLRIINKTDNKIWEIYGVESDILNAGESLQYVSHAEPSINYLGTTPEGIEQGIINLLADIAVLEERQRWLVNQTQTLNLEGPRLMDPSDAESEHDLNAHTLRIMYAALGTLRGQSYHEIENAYPELNHPLYEFDAEIQQLANEYSGAVIYYPDIYRTSFSTKGDIEDQTNAIYNAFNLFKDYEDTQFSIGFKKSDGLSLIVNSEYNTKEFLFQRITSQMSFPISDPNGVFNNVAHPNDIIFYGTIIPSDLDFNTIDPFDKYGPVDFELLGYRKSMMIEMYDHTGYFVYSFDTSISKNFTSNVLYNATDGWNRLIQNFDISTGISHKTKYIEDPISSKNYSLILTENEITLEEDKIWYGYDVFPLSVSIMGINPVKYLDYTVYDSSSNDMNYKSDYWYNREGDVSTYTLSISPGTIKNISGRNSYEIYTGSGHIEISDSSMNYNITSDPFTFNTFFGDVSILAISETLIRYNDLNGTHTYESYCCGKSEESIYDYYLDPCTKKSLKYSLTVPTISKWSSIGQDVRNNDVRLMLTNDLFTDPSAINSNFIPINDPCIGIDKFSDELSYPIFKYLSAGDSNWKDYVYYDINDVIDTNNGRKKIRDLIFDNPYSDVFSKLLYNNNDISGSSTRSSITYYNLYQNQIISIVKGLKIGLSVTSNGERNFNVTNWNRYRFSLITSPSRCIAHNKPIEVIINENTKTILMIWYQGNDVLNYNKRYSDYTPGKSILKDNNPYVSGNPYFMSFETGDPSYSYMKSPFIVDTAAITSTTENIYDVSTVYDSSICSPFAQFSYNINSDLDLIFNAFSTDKTANAVNDNIFTFTKSFNTFNLDHVSYDYFRSRVSFGRNIVNIGYNYNSNFNYYKDKTCDLDMFKQIIEDNNIFYYFIQENGVLSSEDFVYAPISLTVYDPIKYKSPNYSSSIYTYNGGYKPIFKNVLNFEDNETADFINTVERDFIFSNTNLQTYKNIDQVWLNKVVSEVSESDSSNNILYTSNFNPFKSLWDKDYYILSEGNTQTYIDGYKSDLELPSMFGSKLISLPDEITLDNWNSSNSKLVQGVDYYSLEYNLSKSIIDLFTSNSIFINNWTGLPEVTSDIINRYIIKTILKTYNVSISKIRVDAKSKIFDGTILNRIDDGSFTDRVTNLDSLLTYVNDEYIYKIKFNKSDNRSYYIKFTFNKK